MSYYWIFGVLVFLFVLSVHKYKDIDVLKENLQDYFNKIDDDSDVDIDIDVDDKEEKKMMEQEGKEWDEKQERKKKIEAMMLDFVVSNPDIFSLVEVKDE